MSQSRWHKRSDNNGDTHWGVLRPDGFVAARCGAMFQPIEDLFTPRVSLQVEIAKRCARCSASPDTGERHEDATRVEDLMTTLVRPRRTTKRSQAPARQDDRWVSGA
jgi:hypothetical protein